METFEKGSVLDSFDTGIIIAQYYGHYDSAYLLFSKLNVATRTWLHEKIEVVSKLMEHNKSTLKLEDTMQKSLKDIVTKVPLGLYNLEIYLHDQNHLQQFENTYSKLWKYQAGVVSELPEFDLDRCSWKSFIYFDFNILKVSSNWDQTLSLLSTSKQLNSLNGRFFKTYFCFWHGLNVENVNIESISLKRNWYKESTADKFENNKISSINQLILHEVGESKVWSVVADYVKTTNKPIKMIKTGIWDEKYWPIVLSEYLQETLEELNLGYSQSSSDIVEVYKNMKCKNLKKLKISSQTYANKQVNLNETIEFIHTFTDKIDFEYYTNYEELLAIEFKCCYIMIKSSELMTPDICFADSVKIKTNRLDFDFDIQNDYFVYISSNNIQFNGLRKLDKTNLSQSINKSIEVMDSAILTENWIGISMNYLNSIKFTDKNFSTLSSNKSTQRKITELFKKWNMPKIKITDYSSLLQSDNEWIMKALPTTTLYEWLDLQCLDKRLKISNLTLYQSYGEMNKSIEDPTDLIVTLADHNCFKYLTDIQICLINESKFCEIFSHLMNCRMLKDVRIFYSAIEDTSNYSQMAASIAEFLKEFCMTLSSFTVRESQNFVSHSTCASLFCEIQIPRYLIDLVKQKISGPI